MERSLHRGRDRIQRLRSVELDHAYRTVTRAEELVAAAPVRERLAFAHESSGVKRLIVRSGSAAESPSLPVSRGGSSFDSGLAPGTCRPSCGTGRTQSARAHRRTEC